MKMSKSAWWEKKKKKSPDPDFYLDQHIKVNGVYAGLRPILHSPFSIHPTNQPTNL